jgi:hypothetical protein
VAAEGSLQVNGKTLQTRDAAEVVGGAGPTQLHLQAGDAPPGAHFLLIEMAKA